MERTYFVRLTTEKNYILADFQACTEMIMPMCTYGGDEDIFEPYRWNFETYAKYCKYTYGFRPKTDLIEKEYGGKNLKAASNIIFR